MFVVVDSNEVICGLGFEVEEAIQDYELNSQDENYVIYKATTELYEAVQNNGGDVEFEVENGIADLA